MTLVVPEWLNADYIKKILRFVEDDNTVQVTDIYPKNATDKGDNYTSDMIRVMIEFSRNQGDKKVHEKKSILFKFEPIEEGPRRDLVTKIELFDTEISMLTDTLKKMNEMISPELRFSARVYHVRMEPPMCLIMEDLALLGFRMACRQAGLDLAHAVLAIRRLAMFHATSVALCEKKPKYKEQYRKGMFSDEYPKEIHHFMISSCKSLAEEMEGWPEFGKPYAEKIRKLAETIYDKGLEVTKRNDNEFNVINHGDCWVNNMLFRYDDNGKPVGHIFVDFQLSIYTTPAIDLHYFMATSLSEEVYDNNRNYLLDEYLRTLSDTMTRLNCETSPPSMEELQRYLKERAMYHFISSISIFPVMLTDKSEVIQIDELIKPNDMKVQGVKSPIFRRAMGKRIPKFEELGLLDP